MRVRSVASSQTSVHGGSWDSNLKLGCKTSHAAHLLMLSHTIAISILPAANLSCKLGLEERGLREAYPPSVILISSPFFFSISVCHCFQGWRSGKCQPSWMYAVLLCAFISIRTLFTSIHISEHSPRPCSLHHSILLLKLNCTWYQLCYPEKNRVIQNCSQAFWALDG